MIAKSRGFLLVVGLGLALSAIGCAKGANTFDDTINGSGGGGSSTCGNGMIDATEQCDPLAALPATATCMTMTGGPGVPACNPTTCMLDSSMCSARSGAGGH